jgi:hypothetical protein
MKPITVLLIAGLATLVFGLSGAGQTGGQPAAPSAAIKVDQVGYRPGAPKVALVAAEHPARSLSEIDFGESLARKHFGCEMS